MSAKDKDEENLLTRKTLIIRALDQKNQDAWEELIEYYKPFIINVLRHFKVWESDLNDISQIVTLNLWKKLDSFQPGRSKFRTWLYTVIRNAVFVYQKKAGKDRARDNNYFEENQCFSDNDLQEIYDREWRVYLTNLALENIRKNFSGNAIQTFLLCLQNKAPKEI